MPAATDDFSTNPESPSSTSYDHAAAVATSDTVDLTHVSRALYIGVSGDVVVNTQGGEATVLFKAVPVGVLPVRATRVKATNTTATNIVALW